VSEIARHRGTAGGARTTNSTAARDATRIPQFFRAQLTPQGAVVIDGYVQLEKDGLVHGWTAEVGAEGKMLREEVGSVELGKRNSMP
jgi:hypothetical protein